MRLTGGKEGVGVGGRERRHAGEKGGEEIERMEGGMEGGEGRESGREGRGGEGG